MRRIPHGRALAASTTHRRDYVTPYVAELGQVVDMARIAAAGVHIGVDPLGGSGIAYWAPIAERDDWAPLVAALDEIEEMRQAYSAG